MKNTVMLCTTFPLPSVCDEQQNSRFLFIKRSSPSFLSARLSGGLTTLKL